MQLYKNGIDANLVDSEIMSAYPVFAGCMMQGKSYLSQR